LGLRLFVGLELSGYGRAPSERRPFEGSIRPSLVIQKADFVHLCRDQPSQHPPQEVGADRPAAGTVCPHV